MFKLNLKYPIIWLICLLRCIKFELNWIGIERKWIELELNWKILNPIWIGIELNWKILNPTWIGISHIRHSRTGGALLRWRKECGRLWVLLGSTVHMVQAGPHAQSGMCIDSYLFLPEISSFVITCTYRFTTDDNHLQNSTILSSVICVIQVISSHYINPTLIFFSELDRGIIWKFCIIRLQ